MGLNIPGLSDALEKLDTTAAQMEKLVNGIDRVTVLLEEQNQLLRGRENT